MLFFLDFIFVSYKISKSNLTVLRECETPYFEEANLVVICKKIHSQQLISEGFEENDIEEKFYPDKTLHWMYTGEIIKVLVK